MPRLAGFRGAVYLGNPLTKVGDIINWEFEYEAQIAKASVKMDLWDRQVPGRGNGRITADRIIQTTAALAKEVADAVNSGEQLAFRLDVVDANSSFQQISGTAYMARGTIGAPADATVDSVEMILDGIPTFT